MKRAWQGLLAGTGVAICVLFSCGPSMQSIHESNVRFEHCYRLDLDPSIAPSHRQACWREWTKHYTYGQSGDRIGYALRRSREIAAGKVALQLQLDGGGPAADDDAGPGAAPISPHAPPPAVAPLVKTVPADAAAPPRDAAAEAAPVPLPAADCTNACERSLRSCAQEHCDAAASCTRCERDYRSCMRRCFK